LAQPAASPFASAAAACGVTGKRGGLGGGAGAAAWAAGTVAILSSGHSKTVGVGPLLASAASTIEAA